MLRRTPIGNRIVDSFRRHRWLFVIALLLTSGTSVAALLLRAKSYTATALTQVTTEDVASELGVQSPDSNVQTVTPSQQNVDHFNDLVNDNLPGGFLDTALAGAHLDKPINVDARANDPRYGLLKKRLRADTESDNLWTISLSWDNPGEAERIAGCLQRQYIEAVGQNRAAQAIATGRFLDSQIDSYETRMRGAEQALIDYKKNNSGQLPEAQSADIGQLSSLKAELDNMQVTARDSDLKKAALQARIAQIKPLSILEQTQTDSPLSTQIKTLLAQRDALLAQGKLPAHPQVVALDSQIAQLKKDFAVKSKAGAPEAGAVMQTKLADNPEYQSLQAQLTEATIAADTQKAQMAHLQQEVADYEVSIQKIPAEQRELTDKTRDYAILKAEYESLLQRREQIKIKGDLDKVSATSTLTPIGQIYAEPSLSKSKRLMLIALSVVLGALVGIVLVVLAEWADPSLRDEADAARLLGIPVLGAVPEVAALRAPSRAALPAPPSLPELEGAV